MSFTVRSRRIGLLTVLTLVLVAPVTATAVVIHLPSSPEPEPSPLVSPRPIPPPFELLPDGRIGIEIFGQKIRLPVTATDPDQNLDLIEFYPLRARPFGERSTPFTLRRALMEPEKAKLAFEQEPNWVAVHILSWPDHRPDGHKDLDRRLVPERLAGFLTIIINRAPESGPPNRGALPHWWPPESPVADEDGFFVRPGVKLPRPLLPGEPDPTDTGYRLPAAQRLWPTEVDLAIVCSWVGAPYRVCGQTQRTADGRISIGWRWYEHDYPKPRWKELDLRLYQVANYLLLNKPSGELE